MSPKAFSQTLLGPRRFACPVTASCTAAWAVAVVTSHQANKHSKFAATEGLFLYLILIKLLY